MANNLGRDQLWTPDIWADIDKAVLAEVGSIRVVQKVFNSTNVPNAANVPADQFDPGRMAIVEGTTKPLIELSVDFSLTQSQVDNESTLHTARTIAKLAGKSLAMAEDMLLLRGADAELPENVVVQNRSSAQHGLIGEVPPVVDDDAPSGLSADDLFDTVTKGIAKLTTHGQPGPYALIVGSSVYAAAFSPLPTTLVTAADRLIPLLTGGLYGTGAMPPGRGLLVSLGGEPTSIYVAQDAVTAYTQKSIGGILLFRAFERVQFVARDRTAFENLAFVAAAKHAAAAH